MRLSIRAVIRLFAAGGGLVSVQLRDVDYNCIRRGPQMYDAAAIRSNTPRSSEAALVTISHLRHLGIEGLGGVLRRA